MNKSLPAEDLDRLFDDGGDMSEYIDQDSTRPLNLETKRVSVDVPAWMVQAIDRQASKIGVSRQAFIKFTLHEKLDSLRHCV
ncbi:MAG: BrnA antitoxin family protein [Desulfobulbaceae bacterium]|jgi:predicted DNA binding CopG/RHH family protein|nr:BrnA antitoxin family protein [Desulfobulbaceae bacterium]